MLVALAAAILCLEGVEEGRVDLFDFSLQLAPEKGTYGYRYHGNHARPVVLQFNLQLSVKRFAAAAAAALVEIALDIVELLLRGLKALVGQYDAFIDRLDLLSGKYSLEKDAEVQVVGVPDSH